MSKADKFRKGNFREHVLAKSMWLGADVVETYEDWIWVDGKLVLKKLNYSHAALKVICEIIENAIDHWYEDRSVKEIRVYFQPNGEIGVYNDGNGFPLRKIDGDYIPTIAATKEFSGSNLSKDKNRVVGGTNGLGMKLVNILSDWFEIETVDPDRKLYFYQRFEKNMETIFPEETHALNSKELSKEERKPHTHMSYLPSYSEKLGYVEWTTELVNDLQQMILMRMRHLACYISCFGGGCKVYFNDQLIECTLPQLVAAFPMTTFTGITLKGPGGVFPWHIYVGATECLGWQDYSIVNALFAKAGGSHIKLIRDGLKVGLRVKMEPLLNKYKAKFTSKSAATAFLNKVIEDRLMIVFVGQIGDPKWGGQTKQEIMALPDSYKKHWDPALIGQVWKFFENEAIDAIMEKVGKKSTRKRKAKIDKYKKAKKAGGRYGQRCKLIIPEGDAAQLLIEDGFSSKTCVITSEYYGIFNISGVPMNARKHITIKKNPKTGKSQIIVDKQLGNNETLQGLMQVLNLDYSKSYATEAERKTLDYGEIIIATDQDTDGIGQICGMIMNFFAVFWPELLKHDFIKRWETPVVRAFSKKKVRGATTVKDFYSEEDFEKWFAGESPDSWTIEYYKGLAAHQDAETIKMFNEFEDHLFVHPWDPKTHEIMEVIYGKKTDPRKKELTKPLIEAQHFPDRRIPISYHLLRETKAHQLKVIERKLASAVDGLIPVQRKIVTGARQNPEKMKVFQLAGRIADQMRYHHGDMSLNGAIIKLAQNFIGARNLPLVLPLGKFGSRSRGTAKAGSPRYIATKINKLLFDAIFPPEDTWLLPYTLEDGVQCEPNYYAPIVPMSILETQTTTGPGWNISSFARDFAKVLTNVRAMISSKKPTPMPTDIWIPPKYDIKGNLIPNKMEVRMAKTSNASKTLDPMCFGYYEMDEKSNDTIYITELPLRTWTKPYVDSLNGTRKDKKGNEIPLKKYVKDAEADISKTVNIKVKLIPGGLASIQKEYGDEYTDPIEEYLELRTSLRPSLNMFGAHGKVEHFKNYIEVMEYWFPIRKHYYELRLQRRLELLRLRILFLENLIRYWKLTEAAIIVVAKGDDEPTIIKQLEKNKLVKFNRPVLNEPKYTPVDKLREVILGLSANYNYILDLRQRDMLVSAQKSRKEELKKLKAQLASMEKMTWQKLWRDELNNLEKIVNDGIRTNWMFKNTNFRW